MAFPIIDITNLADPDEEIRISREIAFASRTFGFLSLKGHEISRDEIDSMYTLLNTFFSLPADFKLPYARDQGLVRYESPKKAGLQTVFLSGPPGSLQQAGDTLPPSLFARIERVETFKAHCQEVVLKLARCFAIAMNLSDTETFASVHRADASPVNHFRVIRYPSGSPSEDHAAHPPPDSQAIWTSPWSGAGAIVLSFARRSGLEVEVSRDHWVPIPEHDGYSIVVDVGDAVAAWSRRQLRASRYRYTMDAEKAEETRYGMIYCSAASMLTTPSAWVFTRPPIWVTPGDEDYAKGTRKDSLVDSPMATHDAR